MQSGRHLKFLFIFYIGVSLDVLVFIIIFLGVKVWRRRYVHRYVCRNPVLTRFEFLDVKCVIENGRPAGIAMSICNAHIVWLAAPFFCMKWDKTLSHFLNFKSPPFHPTTGILKIKKKRLSKLLLGPSLTQSEKKKKKTSRVSKKSSVPFDTYANETLSLSFLYIYFFVSPPSLSRNSYIETHTYLTQHTVCIRGKKKREESTSCEMWAR